MRKKSVVQETASPQQSDVFDRIHSTCLHRVYISGFDHDVLSSAQWSARQEIESLVSSFCRLLKRSETSTEDLLLILDTISVNPFLNERYRSTLLRLLTLDAKSVILSLDQPE